MGYANTRISACLDWLTLVVRTVPNTDPYTPTKLPLKHEKHIGEELGSEITNLMLADAVAMKFGRAPYRWGFKSELSKVVVFAGGEAPHLSVELSGQSCQWARMLGIENQLLLAAIGLGTRADFAVDTNLLCTPVELADMVNGGRTKTKSVIQSSTGETVYLGSQKSEHYARIYRYADPHPRANMLRIEFVQRRERCKAACQALANSGIESLVKSLWEEAGLPDLVDFGDVTFVESLNKSRPERDGKNTVSWLVKQAAPAFQRMVREGHISNSEQFLRQYFLNEDIDGQGDL